MQCWFARGAVPYFIAVFLSSFVQMGLFILFQRWLSFSFTGASFFWRSMLLQFSLFVPCIFMVAPASFFSCRFPKGRVMAWSSFGMTLTLVAIAVLFGLDIGWVAFGLMLLFGIFLSIHSPAKLGILKEIFGDENLAKANAWQSFFAILGMVLVSFLTISINPGEDSLLHYEILPYIFLGVSFLGTIFSFFIHGGKIRPSIKMRSPKRNLQATWSVPLIRMSILGLAIFWGIAQMFVVLSQDISGEQLVSVFQGSLIFAAIGIVVGSFIAAKASEQFVEIGLVPVAAVGAAVSMVCLFFVDSIVLTAIFYALLGIFAGANFIVLKTVIQHYSRPDSSGRVLAVANMIQMSVLFLFLGVQSLLLIFTSIEVKDFFLILAVVLTICFALTLRQTPQALLRTVLRFLFAFVFRYRLKIFGGENIPETGPVLLVGSHYSFIDWAVLQMASPRPLKMASNRNKSNAWYQRWLRYSKFLIQIDRRNPEPAMQAIREALMQGEAVVIFPEGEVSKTPHISRFSIDYSSAIKDTESKILPFYIQGLFGGPYSHAEDSIMFGPASTRIVSVGFGSLIPAQSSEENIRIQLRDLAIDTWETAISYYHTIVPMWLRVMRRRKFKTILIDPKNGRHVSAYKMIRLVLLLSRRLSRITQQESNLGFLLPSSREGVLGFLSILSLGKTSVNLNYTSPADVVMGCIKNAKVKTVVTSENFYEKLCQKNPNFSELKEKVKFFFIDKEENDISKVTHFIVSLFTILSPKFLIEFCFSATKKLSDTAVILFSSGSEGVPKGIMLSHKNLIANTQQIDSVVRLKNNDVMLAELPMFHSFGVTGNILLSLLDGIPMVLCPDPTDIKTMARACAEYKATILFGTPTFLRAFSVNRWVHPMCLDYIRFVGAGAEKLRPEMRESFRMKFGKEIFEVYGCTETAPMATMNSPNVLLDDFLTMEKCSNRESVGLPVPGTRICIADPETNEFLPIGSEGMVLVGGPQVMKGYLNDETRTASSIVIREGKRWYRTGDKGKIDQDGFLILLDRYSRFAKLGGEMISLGAVEQRINETGILAGMEYLTVSVADLVKGERIVLLFVGDKNPDEVAKALRHSGIPPLMLPGSVFAVEALPKLGSGKWDYTGLKNMANELMQSLKK
ncbi:MAG: MFS transporter [Fibrobacteraceae bacterium]|nr:MFS transporter [Fibrobacteraceae bacterium]